MSKLPSTEEEFQEWLNEAFFFINEDDSSDEEPIRRCISFEEAGLLTNNVGTVVELTNGAEFQLTIVQSASAKQRSK